MLEDLNFAAYYFQTLRERAADKREGRYPPSIEPLYLGLQTFLWPFVLVMAIALRLTKTTIEVYGWATDNPILQAS